MSEPINLNKARKARVKAAAERQAALNRVRHGRTKAEREALQTELDAATRRLDALRVEARGEPATETSDAAPPEDPGSDPAGSR